MTDNVVDLMSRKPKPVGENDVENLEHYGPSNDFLIMGNGMALQLAMEVAISRRDDGYVEGIFVHQLLCYLEDVLRGVHTTVDQSSRLTVDEYILNPGSYRIAFNCSSVERVMALKDEGQDAMFEHAVHIDINHFERDKDDDEGVKPGKVVNLDNVFLDEADYYLWPEGKIRRVMRNINDLALDNGGFTSIVNNSVFVAILPCSPFKGISVAATFGRPIHRISTQP